MPRRDRDRRQQRCARAGGAAARLPAVHDDLVQRDFTAPAPDGVWVTDITEHPTGQGELYCRAIKDLFSNRIVGYALDERMTAQLAVTALRTAVARRQPTGVVVIHSDRWRRLSSLRVACAALVVVGTVKGESDLRVGVLGGARASLPGGGRSAAHGHCCSGGAARRLEHPRSRWGLADWLAVAPTEAQSPVGAGYDGRHSPRSASPRTSAASCRAAFSACSVA